MLSIGLGAVPASKKQNKTKNTIKISYKPYEQSAFFGLGGYSDQML